jgi:transposase InsO family protein
VAIELADEERVALQAWTRRRTSAAALSQRARIVLGCAAGQSNTEVARRLVITKTLESAPRDATPWSTSFVSKTGHPIRRDG